MDTGIDLVQQVMQKPKVFLADSPIEVEDSPVLKKFKLRLAKLKKQEPGIRISKDGIYQQRSVDGKPIEMYGIVCYDFPIAKITLDAEYNRDISANNVKNISSSVEKNGLYQFQFAHLELKDGALYNFVTGETIDKQHLTTACIELGITTINVVLYAFETNKQVISYYVNMNKWQKSTGHASELLAHARDEEPIGTFIYRINNDRKYPWAFGRAGLQKPYDIFTGATLKGPSSKLNAPVSSSQSEAITRFAATGSTTESKKINREPLNIALLSLDYDEVAIKYDEVLKHYVRSIDLKNDNTIRAFLKFFKVLKTVIKFNFNSKRECDRLYKKLSSIHHIKLREAGSRSIAIRYMVDALNAGVQKENKIPLSAFILMEED